MKSLISIVVAMFAAVSFSAFAASHAGGAMDKGDKKAEKMDKKGGAKKGDKKKEEKK